MKRATMVTVAYIALLIVMGGRTALFVSNFDNLLVIDLFGGQITILSILMAVALMLAVAGSSWWRAHYAKNARANRTATAVMIGAAVLDGAFNVSEATILASSTGILDDYVGVVKVWLWFTVLLIGVGPTLLTMGLSSLAGHVDQDARRSTTSRRTTTSVALAVKRTVDENPALERHWTTIVRQLNDGDTFTREQVEQWTGLSKGQSVNVLNYARQRGHVESPARGVYVYTDED